MARLAAHERQGQFFASIGSLHNFRFVFLFILTKRIFLKSIDFPYHLCYTYVTKNK